MNPFIQTCLLLLVSLAISNTMMANDGRTVPSTFTSPRFVSSVKTFDSIVSATASAIFATLEDSNADPVDIEAATVMFKMAAIGGGTTVVAAVATNAQIGAGTTDASIGAVVYDWASGGVPGTAGRYIAEWEVTFSNGSVQTFPNGGYMLVDVREDL